MSKSLHESIGKEINVLSKSIYAQNVEAGWWDDSAKLQWLLMDGDIEADLIMRMEMNIIAAKMALMHSELSEGLEGLRKDLMDDHLPNRKMVEVEFADAVIRILDTAAHMGLDIGGAIAEKLDYNSKRSDHKRENRALDGGKKI